MPTNFELQRLKGTLLLKLGEMACPDARERAGPVGEEETQAQRARARRDKEMAAYKR